MKSIILFFFSIYEKLIVLLLQPVFYKEKKFPLKRLNERPVEYGFAFNCIAEHYPKTLLDVGTGTTAFPHLVANCGIKPTAIDQITRYWNFGMSNRHFKITRNDITAPTLGKKFDMITCISTLEHIPEHRKAVKGMFTVLADGGQIVLSFPYNENHYLPDVYRHPQAGYGQEHKFVGQVYSRNELNLWLQDNNAEIVKQEYYEAFSGEFWTMGIAIYPLRKSSSTQKHHLTCLLLRKIKRDGQSQ